MSDDRLAGFIAGVATMLVAAIIISAFDGRVGLSPASNGWILEDKRPWSWSRTEHVATTDEQLCAVIVEIAHARQ